MSESASNNSPWRVRPRTTSGGGAISLDQPRLIAILNITPDSFSDGGRYLHASAALARALQMHEQGASIIDIGGESSRPGANHIEPDEQIRRTLPVIQAIRRELEADQLLLSIDTTSSEVALAAIDAGVNIINDISAGLDDLAMLELAAERQCGIILMHRRVPPKHDSYSHQYQREPDYGDDVVHFVRDFLRDRRDAALAAGIHPHAIVLDPGLGFGKSVRQNYALAGRIGELRELNCHLLSACSRKSFLSAADGSPTPPAERLAGTLALSVAHYLAGVRLFRVHDVAEHRQAFAAAAAMQTATAMPMPIAAASHGGSGSSAG